VRELLELLLGDLAGTLNEGEMEQLAAFRQFQTVGGRSRGKRSCRRFNAFEEEYFDVNVSTNCCPDG